jgi:hypothetical protein
MIDVNIFVSVCSLVCNVVLDAFSVELIHKLKSIRQYIQSRTIQTLLTRLSVRNNEGEKNIQQRLLVCPYPLAIHIYTTTRRKSNRKREREKETFIIY